MQIDLSKMIPSGNDTIRMCLTNSQYNEISDLCYIATADFAFQILNDTNFHLAGQNFKMTTLNELYFDTRFASDRSSIFFY